MPFGKGTYEVQIDAPDGTSTTTTHSGPFEAHRAVKDNGKHPWRVKPAQQEETTVREDGSKVTIRKVR